MQNSLLSVYTVLSTDRAASSSPGFSIINPCSNANRQQKQPCTDPRDEVNNPQLRKKSCLNQLLLSGEPIMLHRDTLCHFLQSRNGGEECRAIACSSVGCKLRWLSKVRYRKSLRPRYVFYKRTFLISGRCTALDFQNLFAALPYQTGRMIFSQVAMFAGLFVSSTEAINLTVSSTGGNASSALQYGIMFEVNFLPCYRKVY
jgi:hypothetical protein